MVRFCCCCQLSGSKWAELCLLARGQLSEVNCLKCSSQELAAWKRAVHRVAPIYTRNSLFTILCESSTMVNDDSYALGDLLKIVGVLRD